MPSTDRFRRLSVFGSLFLSVVALALASSALHTDFWIQADTMRRNGTESNKDQMNSGLFHGIRQLDWKFWPKRKHFSVFDELQSGISFVDRNVWFALLLSIGLGFLWNIVCLSVTLKNCTKYSENFGNNEGAPHTVDTVIVGPFGVCLWATLTTVSYSFCAAVFLWQFFTQFRHNVLLSENIAAGFSSDGCLRLGFSFWLLISAIVAQFVPCVLLFWAFKGTKKGTNEEQKSKEQDTAFLY